MVAIANCLHLPKNGAKLDSIAQSNCRIMLTRKEVGSDVA